MKNIFTITPDINSIPVINKQEISICRTKGISNGNSFNDDTKIKQNPPTINIEICE